MSKNPKLPPSLKKYIRRQKAAIRRQTSDPLERERLINELYQKFVIK